MPLHMIGYEYTIDQRVVTSTTMLKANILTHHTSHVLSGAEMAGSVICLPESGDSPVQMLYLTVTVIDILFPGCGGFVGRLPVSSGGR